ncbi:MAG: DUF5330 domain-containing protein [Aestuariivirga sp.]
MGLIRKALIVGGLFYALPSPPATPPVAGVDAPLQSSTFATISAAAETIADFKGFCERRPQACVTGQYLAVTLEGKARYTARLLYEWANPTAPVQVAQTPEKKLVPKVGPPPLRLATLTENKPTKIEDLLRASEE